MYIQDKLEKKTDFIRFFNVEKSYSELFQNYEIPVESTMKTTNGLILFYYILHDFVTL